MTNTRFMKNKLSDTEPQRYLSVADVERHARERLTEPLFFALFGNEGDGEEGLGQSVRNAVLGYRQINLRPRVLRAAGEPNLAVEVLGQEVQIPILLAPIGSHARLHPDGELATVRAAGAEGTLFTLSTLASNSLEAVAKEATGPIWFQLYMFKNRGVDEMLIDRAEAAGYGALVLTVDVLKPTRERSHGMDATNEVRRLPNLEGNEYAERVLRLSEVGTGRAHQWLRQDIGWSDVEWLRTRTKLPVVIKGIQTAEDAALACQAGVDALIVSNHGGHGSDFGAAPVDQLPEVVDAVEGRLEVYVDGGIRRGSDALKARALGAKAVFIGRSMAWGLAAGGESGVRSVLQILRDDLERAMAACGVADVQYVERMLVAR